MLAEAFRVLKRGGRFAVSDVVKRAEVEFDVELWAGCIAGALHEVPLQEHKDSLRRTVIH